MNGTPAESATRNAIANAKNVEVRATWLGLNEADYGYVITAVDPDQPPQCLHISNFRFPDPAAAISAGTAVVESIRTPKSAN